MGVSETPKIIKSVFKQNTQLQFERIKISSHSLFQKAQQNTATAATTAAL